MQRYLRLLLILFAAGPTAVDAVDFLQLDTCTVDGPDSFCYKSQAVLSPDAQWYAYTDETTGWLHEYYPRVVVRARDGSGGYGLWIGSSQVNHSPSWSPNGQSMAFVSYGYTGEASGLWVVDLVARAIPQGYRHLVAESPISNPRWSLDGNFIAYERQGQGIWMVPRHGGVSVNLVPDGKSPSWGPELDMVFERSGDLWIRNSLGKIIRLTETSDDESQPAWAPSGEWIAYSSNQSGNGDIWVIAPTGGTPVQVTYDKPMATSPSWSADGKTLMFLTLEGPDTIWLATDLPDFTTSVERLTWGKVKTLFR